RHTIRRAVAGLARDGLVRVEQGRGTFLADHAIDYALGPRTRFSENLLQQGRQPGHEFIRILEVPAPPEAAEALELPASARVLLLDAIGSADGRPISFSTTYFVLERLPGLAAVLPKHSSITQALGEIGVGDYRRRSTRIVARSASEEERRLLRLIE